MFIRRAKLKEFQCHGKLEIEFGPGLNAILGESDRGKTAILRAIRWALFNRPEGQAFKRHGGGAEMSVELELDDGTVIRRVRSKRVNRYVLTRPGEEPVQFDNFGREVPDEIIRATGVKPAVFRREGLAIEISYGGQFSPPFLLTESGLVRAQVLGYISRTSILDATSRKLNDQVRQLGRDIVAGERERDRLTEELARFGDLEAEDLKLTDLETAADAAREDQRRTNEVARIGREIDGADRQLTNWRGQVARLGILPDAERLGLLADRVGAGQRLAEEIGRVETGLTETRAELERTGTADVEVDRLAELGDVVLAGAALFARAMEWKAGYESDLEALEKLDAAFGDVKAEYVAALERAGLCPTCFQNVDDDAARHAAEVLGEGGG